MLSFQDFFTACAGVWTTERTYHSVLKGEIERSHTEFRATSLDQTEKQQILSGLPGGGSFAAIKLDVAAIAQQPEATPGFAIAFDTRSETGEEVSMSLKALFLPDTYVQVESAAPLPIPSAAQIKVEPDSEIIQGYYLRDKGYSETGAIAGRFTYQPTRQTLEMTTFYNRSVAVDQMRFVAPDLRMRTIVTYQRPTDGTVPTVIDLIGFGVERKQ
ncbi:MAG: phycobiliprotein lyase [Leptolyngbyaceae cyanobacterium RM2_2_4]|nr:phycobiliprotein lyase [Leptolyngbyaceae cyanobacterium SM1_4_3]NJN92030.1 phycobiliprotein lyase [Leptolyngbyaceae cyanobacterium SL_5_14]NJO53274.1 phycobiliprotein lyase [Leptolyngbyaceae cyanobacterium RM2_2_4]